MTKFINKIFKYWIFLSNFVDNSIYNHSLMRYLSLIFFLSIFASCTYNADPPEAERTEPIIDSVVIKKELEQKKELEKLYKPYDPLADADVDIQKKIAEAQKTNKNIIIQAGGNWCIWCLRFEKFKTENTTVHNFIANNFLYYYLNYSDENKNEKVLTELGNPGLAGYPVFIILNPKGEVIHIQGSEELEDGDTAYDENRVMSFLNKWAKA